MSLKSPSLKNRSLNSSVRSSTFRVNN